MDAISSPPPHSISFGGLRTPAPECVAPSSWAGIRKPSQSRSPLKKHEEWLLELVRQQPDLTLEEIQRRLLDERQQKAGLGSVWRFFYRHRNRFKKNVPAAEHDPPAAGIEPTSMGDKLHQRGS